MSHKHVLPRRMRFPEDKPLPKQDRVAEEDEEAKQIHRLPGGKNLGY